MDTESEITNTTSLMPDSMSATLANKEVKHQHTKIALLAGVFFLVFLAVGYVQAARADGFPKGTQIVLYSQVPNGFPSEAVPKVGYQLQFANRVDYPTGRTVFTVTYGVNKPVSVVIEEIKTLFTSQQWNILAVSNQPGVGVVVAQSNNMNLSATIVPDVTTASKVTIQVEVN